MFIEHHECASCNSEICEIPGFQETEHHHNCNSNETSCCNQDYSHLKHSEICDIYDFDNQEHKNKCSCFAEYFQIPVFQSEIKSYQYIPEQTAIIWVTFLKTETTIAQNNLNLMQYHAPPNEQYQNTPTHLINCTFLV
jgi:hypothetical protein